MIGRPERTVGPFCLGEEDPNSFLKSVVFVAGGLAATAGLAANARQANASKRTLFMDSPQDRIPLVPAQRIVNGGARSR